MGYETRLHVVNEYGFNLGPSYPRIGEEIASIDLSKCGDGPVGQLIASHTKDAKLGEKAPFALWPRNPDRQYEAVKLLREIAGLKSSDEGELSLNIKQIDKLSNDIEDGFITKDRYNSWLGIIDIDEMIEALKQDIAQNNYRRFRIALAMLVAIKAEFTTDNRLKVITYGH